MKNQDIDNILMRFFFMNRFTSYAVQWWEISTMWDYLVFWIYDKTLKVWTPRNLWMQLLYLLCKEMTFGKNNWQDRWKLIFNGREISWLWKMWQCLAPEFGEFLQFHPVNMSPNMIMKQNMRKCCCDLSFALHIFIQMHWLVLKYINSYIFKIHLGWKKVQLPNDNTLKWDRLFVIDTNY